MRTDPYPDCSELPGSNPTGCIPCWALNKRTRACAPGEGGFNFFGYEHPQYWDVCKQEWRCILGNWESEDQRNIWNAQLLDVRKAALKWYGPWSEEEERAQYAEAVLRWWPGPSFPASAQIDRGPDVTPNDVNDPDVVARYYAILDGEPWNGLPNGGYNHPDLAGKNGPVLKGLQLAQTDRLKVFGAIAPRHYRNLHPIGTVVEGAEYPNAGLDENNMYWLPLDPNSDETIVQLTYGGSDALRRTLKQLANTYSTEDYIQAWERNQALQVGIIAQRIAHTIGAAVLAAFPVTSAWAAPAYAAGNALIDMQQSILDQDASWVDAFNSMNEAGLAFLEVGAQQQQIAAESVNADIKAENDVVTGGQWLTPDGVAAGGPEDTTTMQNVNNWAQASIDATAAAQSGDWDGVQAAFEAYGFDLPDSFLNDLVQELAVVTGQESIPYQTTAPQTSPGTVKTFTGPRQSADVASVAAGLAARGLDPGAFEAATGTYATDAPSPNTAVILAALGLIVGLAWVM